MGNLIVTPFAAVFRWLYQVSGSYGIAVILFGIIVKLVLLPFSIKSKKSMVRMGRLSSKQQELQKKYEKNQQKYNEELQKLYMDEGINPMGGCLWSFLPLFILLPLYSIIRKPITSMMLLGEDVLESLLTAAQSLGYQPDARAVNPEIGLARFISDNWSSFEGTQPGLIQVDYNFLGLDLSEMPQAIFSNFQMDWQTIGLFLIPVISALLSFLMNKITLMSNGQQAAAGQNMMMNIMLPLTSLWIGFTLPAALGIYWIINSITAMVQEFLLGKFYMKKLNAEEDAREAAREADRQRRMEEARRRAQEMREEEARHPKPKKVEKPKSSRPPTNEAGRVGDRPYARGRSYVPDRYE